MSVTIACALQQAKEALAGGESPATDAKVLLAHVLGQTQTWLYTWSDKVLKDEELNRFKQLISERKTGRPVAHLTGNRDFWTLTLNVNPATLIPRPETELLVEKALELLPSGPCCVCDLGTGTGAVALALASERPDIQVTGTDRITEAVDLAKRNAALNHITNASFIVSHWFDALKDKQFDMLVTNPPYGKRLETDPNFPDRLGAVIRRLHRWRVAILSGTDVYEKAIHLAPKNKIPLVNGDLDCHLLIYEIE